MRMLRVQKNRVRGLTKKEFSILRSLCHYSKNLYNVTLYTVRQYYFLNGTFLKYESAYHYVKDNENYNMLLTASGQQTMKVVDRMMKSFFGILRQKKEGNYNRPASLPHYLDKDGLFVVLFPETGFRIRNGKVYIGLSKKFREENHVDQRDIVLDVPKNIRGKHVKEVRLIPKYGGLYYDLEYVYNDRQENIALDKSKYLSIDLGLDNFATLVDSTGSAVIIDGKGLKSINQWYNKENARLQSIKDKQKIKGITKRQSRLLYRRNNKIKEGLNQAVNIVVKRCLDNGIGNVVVGELRDIKQKINHGHVNNQKFVQIPYGTFKLKLKSKCEQYGIEYHEVDEAYTSRTDALAFDEIKLQPYGESRRIERGLYRSITGNVINADVNGALNILRKVSGDSPVRGIVGRGLVNRPRRVRLYSRPPPNQIANATAAASPVL
ncbi:MAG: transposase [Methanocella conradii]|nr:transposase [Methanocella conradii]MDI6897242.1 transposase [Methanocella conradii]